MKATNLEVGQEVEVMTENGIVIGKIRRDWKGTEVRQFNVEFDDCGIKTTYSFSRKTGKPYGNKELTAFVL